jgi:hypothetical protein
MSKRHLLLFFACSLLLLPCVAAASYAQQLKSPLSASAARKLIARVAGVELPSAAVRVRSLSATDKSSVDVLADIDTAFRFVKEQGRWHVAEIRTGDNRWEDMGLVLLALRSEAQGEEPNTCGETNAAVETNPAVEQVDPSAPLARCLIASLAGVELPSDGVRVKSVEPLALGSVPSAVIEARVAAEFRLLRGADGKWRVAQMRTGANRRVDVEQLLSAVNERKKERALDDLKTVALALDAFRRERGFYVEAQSESALVDQLNPRYLRSVVRVDPWHKPYQYEGTRAAYVLRSSGVDGKPHTADDIIRKNDER